jgi:septal ring factor EnvC (AmiA/AmiB activator)
MNTEKIGKVQTKPVEPVDDNPMLELAVAHEALAEENSKLMDMLAVQQMDATPEEKAKAQETLESLRADVKRLEAELHAVKISRDQLQSKTSEMQKQINYWRKKAEKIAA